MTIRTYTKAELAMLYCPDRPVTLAVKTLRRWIQHHPTLMDELRAVGYQPRRKHFMPKEVEMIMERLGGV
jgi:hypothetical protein